MRRRVRTVQLLTSCRDSMKEVHMDANTALIFALIIVALVRNHS